MTDSVRLMQGENDKSVESTQSEPRDAVKLWESELSGNFDVLEEPLAEWLRKPGA